MAQCRSSLSEYHWCSIRVHHWGIRSKISGNIPPTRVGIEEDCEDSAKATYA